MELSLISEIARLSAKELSKSIFSNGDSAKRTENVRETQLSLLHTLTEAGIDPRLFDLMLSRELDRTLKKQFGVAFFFATIFFTILSFGIVVLNGIYNWRIANVAITGLIVETPIQFIGLLYIIARNLFPQSIRSDSAEYLNIGLPALQRHENRPITARSASTADVALATKERRQQGQIAAKLVKPKAIKNRTQDVGISDTGSNA